MVIRSDESIDHFIVERRRRENWGLQRLHKWLNQWGNFSMMDEQVVLAHLLNALNEHNLAVSRTEVRNCFNKYYNKEFHGEKKSYLNWLYSEFKIKSRGVVNSKRSYRVISATKTPIEIKDNPLNLSRQVKPNKRGNSAKKQAVLPLMFKTAFQLEKEGGR